MKKEWKIFAAFAAVFFVAFYLPLADLKVTGAIIEAFKMLQWYARNHTLACVVPALFIAGAITTFLSKEAVLKHLGPKANKVEAYGVASVSGTVLAVCSCSVLPMFAGIYRVGAGLGPASAFLYAGPAINVLALFLTARVLGFRLGVARVVGAIIFGIIIGLIMALIFRKDEEKRTAATMQMPDPPASKRPLWKNALFLGAMILFLIFSDWYNPGDKVVELTDSTQFQAVLRYETAEQYTLQLKQPLTLEMADSVTCYEAGDTLDMPKARIAAIPDVDTWVVRVHHVRWYLAAAMGGLVLLMTWRWYNSEEVRDWMGNTWTFAKLLVPLLFGGVFIVGFLGALLPEKQVAALVGDNSLTSNLVASVVGCFFYFATLTEIPILEALTKNGMAEGPALALLLAGPAMSIPSILVIRSIIGNTKTAVFTTLVIVMATIVGMGYGHFFASDVTLEARQTPPPVVASFDR